MTTYSSTWKATPMKLIRYRDAAGAIDYGRQHDDGRTTRIDGDILGAYQDTGQTADVVKTLAPIEPRDIICIGLNYRKHAEEGKQPIPEYPVLFMKNPGAMQNPGDPIVLPRQLKSDAVDYECELAVVIGKPCKNVPKSRSARLRAGLHLRQRRQRPRLADEDGAAANGAAARRSTRSARSGPAWSRPTRSPIPTRWRSRRSSTAR